MKKQKGFIIPIMIAIVLILTIGGVTYVYLESKKVDKIEMINEETTTLSTSTDMNTDVATTTSLNSNTNTEVKQDVSVNTDTDIQAVSDLLQKYKIAYESGNTKTVGTFYSKATLDFFEQLGGEVTIPVGSKIIIDKIVRSGKNIRAEATEIANNGSRESQNYVFIFENGQWKIDMGASFAAEVQKNSSPQGDPNGYVDLIITGVKIYPSHPIVNNEDVEIAVTIKNIGTKISEKGAPAVAEILENTKYTPVQGGSLAPIGAGENVTWKYSMYGQNEFFKRSDVAGKKTVKVELNGHKDVVEKNYDNNSFTYNFEVFDK